MTGKEPALWTIALSNDTKEINQSCLFCLSHFSFTTVVPTLCEAKKALEVVVRYFENQPTRLNLSERVLLGGIAEKLDPASSQISIFPENTHLDKEICDAPPHIIYCF